MATPRKTDTTTKLVPTESPAATVAPELQALLEQLVKSNQLQQDRLAEEAALKPVNMDAYLRKHPRVELKRLAYQNGYEVNPRGLSQATAHKLDKLPGGSYCGGYIQVLIRPSDNAINFIYENVTPDDRQRFSQRFSSFSAMVNELWREAELNGKV